MNEGVSAGAAHPAHTGTAATGENAVAREHVRDRTEDHGSQAVEEPSAADFRHARTLPVDADWYKRAVFYEVLVRAFADSNRDGFGDLRGLTDKLDYLAWLGVDCLWLPPFYDSPLRDGGYDIRDYRKVLTEFGTVADFVEFLDQAHARGIRVITDLV